MLLEGLLRICIPEACSKVKKAYILFVYKPTDTVRYRRLEENKEMVEKMDKEQFAESIREKLEHQGRFEVELKHVLKNNSVMRCGLLLHSGGNNLVPTIYLEPFFEAYGAGADVEEIVEKILEVYESTPCKMVSISFFRDFSMVKGRLCMKLVNREANAKLLSKVPYREFLDMAVIYYVDYYNPEIGAGTIQVDNSHMEMWDVTEEELWEYASINTPERKPGRIESMKDIMAETFAGPENDDNEFCSCMGKNPVPMLVITNAERVYGAAVILYSRMLKQAADKIGGDLFILPSSMHEVIAIPVIEERAAAELKKIVMEVNRKEVKPEEVLSDNVYIYRRNQDRLEIA